MVVGEDRRRGVGLDPGLESGTWPRPRSRRRGCRRLAFGPPSSSVATPLTTWLAGWTGRPPQVLPDAPPMPICIGPAAPKPFWPLCTPGRVDCPLLLSTVPMPGQDRPRHAVLLPDLLVPEQVVRRDRLGLGAAGWLPGRARLLARAAVARREERVRADQDGHGQQAEPHDAEGPMMPSTRIRGARCSLAAACWVSVRIRSLFVMTGPRSTARCHSPASWCPTR